MLEALELDLAAAELTPGNSNPFVDSDKATWFSGAGKQRRRSCGNEVKFPEARHWYFRSVIRRSSVKLAGGSPLPMLGNRSLLLK